MARTRPIPRLRHRVLAWALAVLTTLASVTLMVVSGPPRADAATGLDPSISFRAHANGRIVTAESAGTQPLIANRTAVGPWEEFDLLV
jgi:hypothetical protein